MKRAKDGSSPNPRGASLALALPLAVAVALAGTGPNSPAGEPPPTAVCPPIIRWQQTFGGAGSDRIKQFIPHPAGGYLGVGATGSTNEFIPRSFGNYDVWLVHVQTNGVAQSQVLFGGSSIDGGSAIAPTTNGGFIVAASSRSGISGSKTSQSFGQLDGWLIRLDAAGHQIWDRAFGGSRDDDFVTVIALPDGGFLAGGNSASPPSGNKTSPYGDPINGSPDFWIVRVNAQGEKLWDKSYGGTRADTLSTVVSTEDGGFLLGGYSDSIADGIKTTPSYGSPDYWVIRIDETGVVLWQQSFGGSSFDLLHTVAPTSDGGFLLAGESYSDVGGRKTAPSLGYADFWIVRIDSGGNLLWDRSLGGTGYDGPSAIHRLANDGFIIAGTSASPVSETKTAAWRGNSDYWVVRTGPDGRRVWDQSFGGLYDDNALSVLPIQGGTGGFLIGGHSSSRPRGQKTSPALGNDDLWLLQLGPETPDDCDSDGVPDARDGCASTPYGDIVDASGCGLSQQCPCGFAWTEPAAYVACVETASARLVASGILTEAARQELVTAATTAECPPIPFSLLAFGLTNTVISEAVLERAGSGIHLSDAGPEGKDGISVQLGQADSGVFLSPYAGTWGDYNEAWFMEGTAFGAAAGGTNRLVSRLRARKPDYETYPVLVDLSPLQPVSVTWQVWSNQTVIAEATVTEAIGECVILSGYDLYPRANAYWRMPDGSVGAIIEFMSHPVDSMTLVGPFGEVAYGERIFIRANQPAAPVDHISRVDIVVGGGVSGFSLTDERIGHFGRAHAILGSGNSSERFVASPGRLQIEDPGYGLVGTLVELEPAPRFDLMVDPIEFTNELANVQFSMNGVWSDRGDMIGSVLLSRETNAIALTPHFRSAEEPLTLKIYRDGVLQGTPTNRNYLIAGRFDPVASNDYPRLVAMGARVDSVGTSSVSILAFTLDRVSRYRHQDGTEWNGDHFEMVGTNLLTTLAPPISFAFFASPIHSVAIIGESTAVGPPPLTIAPAAPGSAFVLFWPARNLPTILESSETLTGTFTRVEVAAKYADGRYRVELPVTPGTRFFRLRRTD